MTREQWNSFIAGYYAVVTYDEPLVAIDEWQGPIEDIWISYVVYPQVGRQPWNGR